MQREQIDTIWDMCRYEQAWHVDRSSAWCAVSLKKDVLIDQDQVENTLLEKNILETLRHPFLVGLQFCFQNSERIYLVMPFLR